MVNVREFGAVGDGVTKDTAAIQKALDKGGTVVVPPGTYLAGTLYMHDDTELRLEPGATLLASPDPADYNVDDFCPQNRVHKGDWARGAHFIVALEARNVAITGTGRIDGNRQAFFTPPEYMHHIWSTPIKYRPGQMLFFCECRDVTLADVEMANYPYWCCFLHGCEYVTIRGLRIRSDKLVRNSDGIDLDCCRCVTVSDCLIETGDDCIAIRGVVSPLKTPRSCEHITISNCVLSSLCNGIRIGVGGGTIRDLMFSNLSIWNTVKAICIISSYSSGNGVGIDNVSFDHLNLDCARAFTVAINAKGRCMGPVGREIRDVSFSHVRGTFCVGSLFQGYEPGDVHGLRFDDLELTGVAVSRNPTFLEYVGEHPNHVPDPEFGFFEYMRKAPASERELWPKNAEFTEFDLKRLQELSRIHRAMAIPPESMRFENVRDAVFDRVRVNWADDDPGTVADVGMLNCQDMEFRDCKFAKGKVEL